MKVVFDTCLYVDLLRSGKWLDLFTERSYIRFISPIVIMELRAGVRNTKQQKAIDRLLWSYSKAGRIIELYPNLFYKSGEIMAEMGLTKRSAKRTLSHDILIALSAYSIGANLFTSNRKDFEKIAQYLPLKVSYL